MASTFPGAIDSFTDPLSGSALNSPSHSAQHADLNDAAEKLETYMGLVKVIPTGATNGTVGATGTVTIGNAVASVAVAGCFSSLYKNYKIQVSNGTGSSLQAIAMTMTGSAVSYYQTLAYWSYAGVATVLPVNNGVQWSYVGESGDSNTINMDILNPNLAKYTQFNGAYIGSVAGVVQGYHAVATAFTGFTISVAGTMTGGTIAVYGYRI